MALWTIKRLETNPSGDLLGLSCTSGEVPMKFVMLDTETGSEEVFTACVDPTLNPCLGPNGVLKVVHGAGYVPADFDTECAF